MALLAAMLASRASRADPPPEDHGLRWDDDRPRFRPLEYGMTAVVGNAAFEMYYWLPAQPKPHWIGGILFDDAVRNALRVRSPSALQTIWTASDDIDLVLVGLAFGESFGVPLLRGSSDVAVQLTLMDLQSFAFNSVISIGLYDSVGRARPSYEDCQRNPSFVGCQTSPTSSFPSGHTAEAFTAAGMSCANHLYVPIYGSRIVDVLACTRDLTLATVDGFLRIVGDRHYMTDTIAGATIGFAVGYGLPTLLHYRAGRRSPRLSWTVSPMVGPETGVVVAGSFL